MDYIRKLPLLLALTGAIITGMVGYTHHVANNDNMARMMVVMLVFYIIGLIIRRTILDTIDTHKLKEQERQEEERLLLEQEKAEEKAEKEKKAQSTLSSTVDLAADEEIEIAMGDEFSNLPVNDYISTELERNN